MTEISDSVLVSYRRSLFHHRSVKTGKPLKFCTQASYLTAVRHWLSWLCDENWLPSNPGDDVELPKAEHRLLASYLSLSEVETLLSGRDVTTAVGLRDRSIQTLMGHVSLNTTQIYTHVTIQRLREVHDKTHPAKPDQPKSDAGRIDPDADHPEKS